MTHTLTRNSSSPSIFFGDRDPVGALVNGFFRGWPQATSDLDEPTVTRGWVPAVDIRETAEGFSLTAELAGLAKKDIEISLDNGLLTLRGERTLAEDADKDDFRRIERSYGSFERTFRLPTGIDASKVEASFENGLLTLTVPKAEAAKARTIKLK